MKVRKILYAVAIAAGLSTTTAKAQDYDLGGFLGMSFYNGDIYPLVDNGVLNAFRGWRPAVGAVARYNFNSRVSLRGNLMFGWIAGYDTLASEGTDRAYRNLSFNSPLLELSGVVEFNIIPYIAGSERRRFAPVVFAGISAAYFDPRTSYNQETYRLRDLKTEPNKSYSPIAIGIPMGLGIKYNIKNDLTLGFEFGWRMTFTDYLDDVSTTYPASASTVTANSTIDDKLSNRTGGTVNTTTRRGNPDRNDAYYFVGLTLTKTFRKYSCGKF